MGDAFDGVDITTDGLFRSSSGLELDLVAEVGHQALEFGLGGRNDLVAVFVAFATNGERFGAGDLLALQRMDHRAGNRRFAGVLLPAVGPEDRAIGETGGAVGESDSELRMLDVANRDSLVLIHW